MWDDNFVGMMCVLKKIGIGVGGVLMVYEVVLLDLVVLDLFVIVDWVVF